MAIKTLRVFQEFTSAGYIPMPVAGNIDYGVTISGTFPGTTPTTFQTDDPDIDVTLTATTDYYVWIRSHGTDWNPMYTRNVRVYPDSPLINNVVMGIIIANLSNTVPYTGANANVNLGEYGLTAGYLGLDLTPTGTPTTAGNIYWDAADGTLNVNLLNSVVTHLGGDLPVLVKSDTNSGLVKGSVVYQKGSDGANTTVLLAQANSEATSSKTFGIIANTTSGGAKAYCITFGYVRGIDTSTLTEGASVYLSPTIAGGFTSTKPQAPNHIVTVGRCIRSHATQGIIFVSVQNGFELDELHDVQIIGALNKDVLVYDTATSLWKNRRIFKTQGYIPFYDDTLLLDNSPIFTNGNNVGIGTTTITEKLVVNGNILATQFKKVGGLSTEFLKADGSSDATAYQPLSADLTAIDNLALTTGLLRKNGTDTWVLDQTEYLALATAISNYQRIDNLQSNLTASATKYPSVNAVNTGLALKLNLTGGTLTGGLTLNYSYPNIALSDVSSGTTWNITNDGGAYKLNYGVTNKFYIFSNGNAEFINNLTASSLIKAGGTSTQFLKADGSVDSTTYQPYDADLSAIGALALTTGLLRKNGANTWELDQTEYVPLSTLIANYQTISNLSSNLTASATKYPSVNAVNTGLNLKLNLSGGTMSGDLALSYSIPTIQFSDTSSGTIWNVRNNGGGFEINSGITNKFTMLSSGNATFVNDLTANKFIKSGGTSAQFLMADGSVSSGVSGGITGTLTTNFITKASGTNTIANSLIYDNGTNVGIGTTSPSYKLDVNGAGNTVRIQGGGATSPNLRIQSAIFPSIEFISDDASTANRNWKIASVYNSFGTFEIMSSTTAGGTDYTSRIAIANSGNLLVGTTTDSGDRVNISGTFRSTALWTTSGGITQWGYGGTAYGGLTWDTGYSAIYATSGNVLKFGANGSSAMMTLNTSGNLGLGVTPSAWGVGKAFEINSAGNSVWSYSNDNIYLTQNSTFNGGWYYGATATAAQYVLFQGKHLWMTAPSGTAGTAISFTQAMTLDASGNLGVGTTSPSSRLHVVSTNQLLHQYTGSPATFAWGQYNTSGDASINNLASANLLFATANTERARISSAGNLLIGTTTDSGYKLDVNGTGRFSSSVTGTQFNASSKYAWGSATNGTTGQIATDNTNNYFDYLGNLYFRGATASNTLITFTSAGAATFSSSVTASTFTANDATYGAVTFNGGTSNGVVGSYGTQLRLINFTASGSTLIQGNGSVDINTQGGYNLTFGTSATERMRITSGGSVGIGTTTPASKLHINNPSTASTSFLAGNINGGTYFGWDSDGTGLIATYSAAPIKFGVNYATTFSEYGRITTGGNWLLGTTTDSGYKLNVNGNAYIYGLQMGADGTYGNPYRTYAFGGASNGYNRIFATTDSTDGIYFAAATGRGFMFRPNGGTTNTLTIDSTGAATFSSSVTATSFFESSDKTIKTLLVDNYQTKGIESITAKLYTKHGKEELGYFAQDVQGILPSAVTMGTNGLLNLSYREVLVAKVQRTETEIEKLKNRVLELETQLNLR